jgi:hypothetical protein
MPKLYVSARGWRICVTTWDNFGMVDELQQPVQGEMLQQVAGE